MELHILYCQARDAIVTGQQPCIFEEAVDLAALIMQVAQGNFAPPSFAKGWLKSHLSTVIALPFHKHPRVEHEIERQWKRLCGMSETNAKFRFIMCCRALRTFGISCYRCLRRERRTQTATILGVCERGIVRIDPTTNMVFEERRYGDLIRWAHTEKEVLLDWSGVGIDRYITTEGSVITELIGGYIDILLKKIARQEALETKTKIP